VLILLIAAVVLGLALARTGAVVRWARSRSAWRPGALAASVATLAGAGFTAVRGEWAEALIFLLASMGLAMSARRRPPVRAARPKPPASAMSVAEAAAVLGVPASASAQDVRAAYARLIRRAHPDWGGTSGLAAQLNVARDVLLRRPPAG